MFGNFDLCCPRRLRAALPTTLLRSTLFFAGLALAAPAPLAGAQSFGLTLGEPMLDLGEAAAPDEPVFGHIVDVAWGPGGAILVLDGHHRRLSAFGPDGGFLRQAGRAGEGPGEFLAPIAVEVVGENVLVFDAGLARVQRFRLDDEGLRFVDSVRLPAGARGFCAIDDLLVTIGYSEGELVHIFTLEGEHVRSFGHPFHDDPVVAQLASNGHVLCVGGDAPAVVVVPMNFPTVYVYGLDGTLRWSVELPGFDGGTVGRSPSGTGVAFGPTEDGRPGHLPVSALDVDGALLVQWGSVFKGMGSLEDITSVTSAAFDLEDGTPLDVPESLPRLDVADGNRVFSHANDPFPRVRVFELTRD
ncbi:MAG: 6-bladed beta-propeller [Gemmatimonadota bacterium]